MTITPFPDTHRAPSSADQKAALIGEALQTLRAAHALDERDDLDAASFVAWYDATIPDVRDIKILAGAMEIELAKRRGARIADEGERRGGDSKVSNSETLMTRAVKMQRHKDRVMAAHPKAVDAYVQRETKAGRVPSRHGAVKAARSARVAKPKPAAPPTRSDLSSVVRVQVRDRLEQVRNQTFTLDELARRWRVDSDIARRYLREVALIADVVKTDDRYTITPMLEMVTLETFKAQLHAEIVRRRKEARDGYHKWRPDNVHTLNQSALLDWLEDELCLRPAQGAKA